MSLKNRLTQAQLLRLQAYRLAASQVRQASIIELGATVGFDGHQTDDGGWVETLRMLAAEPFRSLAMSLRLTYLQGDPAEFGAICAILDDGGTSGAVERVRQLKGHYEGTLDFPWLTFNLHGDLEGRTVGPRELFETWLYYGAFHTDLTKRQVYEELARFGPRFQLAVHAIGLRLAGSVIDLDDVVADLLDEQRVPRIEPPATPAV